MDRWEDMMNSEGFTVDGGIEWRMDGDTLIIRPTEKPEEGYIVGAMKCYFNKTTPWEKNKDSIREVRIEDGVKRINDCAFASCTSLTSVDIPSGVQSIGNSTFYNCTSLTSVKMPSRTALDAYVFKGCPNVKISIKDEKEEKE